MSFYGLNSEQRFEAMIFDVLDRLGVSLTIGTDFNQLEEFIAECRDGRAIGDPFNPRKHELTEDNACWIAGRDKNGKIMHLHALRVLPTEGQSAGEYFRRYYRGYSPPDFDIDFKRSRYRACPDARRMTGNLVYSGEVWVGGEPGQYRGTGLISYLMRYAMLTVMNRFQGDYMIGFVTRPVAYRGAALRFGYMHTDPLALRWYLRDKPDPLEAFFVYMGAEDMRYIMELPEGEMAAIAA